MFCIFWFDKCQHRFCHIQRSLRKRQMFCIFWVEKCQTQFYHIERCLRKRHMISQLWLHLTFCFVRIIHSTTTVLYSCVVFRIACRNRCTFLGCVSDIPNAVVITSHAFFLRSGYFEFGFRNCFAYMNVDE